MKKETSIQLKIALGTKRKAVYKGNLWVDTEPIDITDLSCLDHASKRIITRLRKEISQLENEKTILNQKLFLKEKEQAGEKKNNEKSILTHQRKPKKAEEKKRKEERRKPKNEKKKPP